MANRVLREAVSREGALRLSQWWIREDIPDFDMEELQKYAVFRIRKSAALGLAYSRDTLNGDLLESLYNELVEEVRQRTRRSWDELVSSLVAALAQRNILRTMTFDEYLDLDQQTKFHLIHTHSKKYSSHKELEW